jgi:hypothetical protein
MSQLANQMQAKMAQSLDHLRKQEMAKVKAAGDAVLKLPNIKGSVEAVTNNESFASMNNDDASMIVTQAAGIPGMDMVTEQIATTAIDFYGDREETFKRPQDDGAMSLKQEADIKRQIEQHLAVLFEADRKAKYYSSAMSCGDNIGIPCPTTGGIVTNYDPKFDPEHPAFVPDDNGERTLTPGPSFIHPAMASVPSALSR